MKRRNFLAGLLILPALVKSFAKEDTVMPGVGGTSFDIKVSPNWFIPPYYLHNVDPRHEEYIRWKLFDIEGYRAKLKR